MRIDRTDRCYAQMFNATGSAMKPWIQQSNRNRSGRYGRLVRVTSVGVCAVAMSGSSMKLMNRIDGLPGALSGTAPAPTALNSHRPPPAATCTIRKVSENRLITAKHQQVYIQPLIAVPSAYGDVLIAGMYNFLFEESSPGRWVHTPRDSIFGAIVTRSGATKIVLSPIPTRLLVAPRAVAQPDGTWAVVFGEVEPYSRDEQPLTAVRLWFGILNDGRWSTLEQIPIPPGEQAVHHHASSLVQSGTSFAWALQTLQPTAIGIFERKDAEGWSFERVRTRGGIYPELVYSDAHGLVLLVVHPDYSGEADGNSLFLWTRRPDWTILRNVASSIDGAVHEPTIVLTPSLGVISWFADVADDGNERREARTTVGSVLDRVEPVVALDSSVTNDASVRLVSVGNGEPVWVVDHQQVDTPDREIRFVQQSGGSVETLAAFHNPYVTRMAVASFKNEVILFGGINDAKPGIVVTAVLRMQLDCSSDPASSGTTPPHRVRRGSEPFTPEAS